MNEINWTAADADNADNIEVFEKARDRALRLLSYRARSVAELEKRLGETYPAGIVDRVIKLMQSYGYLDDLQFAKEYIENRTSRGYGEIRIKRELRMKGIGNDVVSEAFADACTDETGDVVSLLETRLRGETCVDFAEKRRCYGFLARRGYPSNVIMKAFKLYFGAVEDN